MRRVPTRQLRTGDRIGRDILSGFDELPLLRAGIRVSDSYRRSLLRANITSVWVDDGLSEGIEPLDVLGEDTRRRATVAIHKAFRDVSRSLVGGTLAVETVHEMADVVDLICADVAANVHSALALNDLANADGYTMRHSLAVTALGLSIGLRVMQRQGWIDHQGNRRFDNIDQRLSTLGVGLLLHDIGKLAVPSEILKKSGPLTEEEWLAMRAHPTLGAEILQHADGISPISRAIVRSHHERWDGAGYPEGKAGRAIHQFARIASVADVFDALTSDRSYRRALLPHEGYEFIVNRAGRDFDPEVVEVFAASVAPHPPGTGVVLSDGRCGIVKEVRQGAVTRPVVRLVLESSGKPVAGKELDLALAPGITIVSTAFDPFAFPHEETLAAFAYGAADSGPFSLSMS
jgi:HD-GYP domain-containing protein (c-di-GMP phosphodiesterase class II)